jgi:hypothetical protein
MKVARSAIESPGPRAAVGGISQAAAHAEQQLLRLKQMSEIDRIILSGGPDPLTADDGEAGGVRYTRALTESIEQFRDRAAKGAEAAGAVSILFGANEDDGE